MKPWNENYTNFWRYTYHIFDMINNLNQIKLNKKSKRSSADEEVFIFACVFLIL